MKTATVLLVHTAFDAAFGWALLSFRRHNRNALETILTAILLGMYLETLLAGTLMFLGFGLSQAGILTGLVMLAAVIAGPFGRGRRDSIHAHAPGEGKFQPKWYELAALFAIGEKILFATWQIARLHTYFDDALRHWSGRARSLFGSVNWSFDPASPLFMGKQIGNGNYPLFLVLWRALSARMNGSWNEMISRADGLIFFVVIVGIVWAAVLRFSNTRWLAAAAAFIVSAVPLLAWHAAAGYSDIAVEAFLVATFAAILRGECLLSGVMAAGAIWSKNDGLVLYVPAIAVAVLWIQSSQDKNAQKWRTAGLFLAGLLTVAPWLVFNYTHSLGITPGQQQLAWHSDAPKLLWDALFTSSASGILWIWILSAGFYIGSRMLKDRLGQGLMLAFVLTFIAIVLIFTSTSAYTFLADQTTIHRVLMQFSATAVLIAACGLGLKIRSDIRA